MSVTPKDELTTLWGKTYFKNRPDDPDPIYVDLLPIYQRLEKFLMLIPSMEYKDAAKAAGYTIPDDGMEKIEDF